MQASTLPLFSLLYLQMRILGLQGMYAGLRISFELQRALGLGVIALGCQDLDWGYGLASWHSEVEGRNAKLVEENNSKDLASSCISLYLESHPKP